MLAESAASQTSELRMSIPQFTKCRQVILITARDWSSSSGQMRCFDRRDSASTWVEQMSVPQVVLGRGGLGWGLGLHRASDRGAPVKREGDGKAPAGVFPVVEAFGFETPRRTEIHGLPYRQITEATQAIDDPASEHYNRIVDARAIDKKDWSSSEMMRRIAPYRWGAVIGHNTEQVRGAGSCIFLHVWEGAGVPTSGCTAMPEQEMLRVLRWLDRSKGPLLVQLPEAEYRQFRMAWQLP